MALVAAVSLTACGSRAATVKVGEPAPEISGATLDGTPFSLEALRGRPVIVNFWASWCEPCRAEFPLFKAQLAEHAGEGLAIVGVLYKDDPELAKAFAEEFGMSWPSVVDTSGGRATDYRVVAAPQTYFIDRDGIVRSIQIGEVREADFERQLEAIMK